jgi:hypothetical protein
MGRYMVCHRPVAGTPDSGHSLRDEAMAETVTEREQEIIDHVIQALPQHMVSAKPMTVHTSDGGESATLRFTMDDMSSTDLKRERIASGAEPADALANQVCRDLLQQIGMAPR